MPSFHVWSNVGSLGSPHLLNQEPPRAQQLNVLDFLIAPHLGHSLLLDTTALVVEAASAGIRMLKCHARRGYRYFALIALGVVVFN